MSGYTIATPFAFLICLIPTVNTNWALDIQYLLTSTQVSFINASKFDHTGQISHFKLLAHEHTKPIQFKARD